MVVQIGSNCASIRHVYIFTHVCACVFKCESASSIYIHEWIPSL